MGPWLGLLNKYNYDPSYFISKNVQLKGATLYGAKSLTGKILTNGSSMKFDEQNFDEFSLHMKSTYYREKVRR